ncbi:MAG: DUF58 domain-containing protein [Verrucomicrobia bacterium]|nr:DUF58 domain-containing protein [Verrucomicrobiota bacterium]
MTLLYKFSYRGYRAATAVDYWVRRRFTKTGLAVLAGLFVSTLMGSDVAQTMAHEIFTFLAALLAVALVAGLRFRARFSAERSLPRLGTAEVSFTYRVLIHNQTSRWQTGLELLEDPADTRPSLADFVAVESAVAKHTRSLSIVRSATRRPRRQVAAIAAQPVPPLPPNGEAEVQVELQPLRRGVLRLDGLVVARPDPFGLFRSFARVRLPQTILILPKRYHLPPVALPGAMQYQQGGVALAASVGESEEFVSLRDYRHGDPLRHIHWKSWAKTGRPIVKEFQDEFFVRHALVLDTFADTGRAEVFEEAVSVAASFACTVLTQDSLLDLMFVGPQAFTFTAGRGVAHVDQMLEVLAAVQLCPDRSFDSLRQLVLDHAATLSGCICVLLAWDESRRKFVEQLRALGLPLRVVVVRSAGETRPLDPGPLGDAPDCLLAVEAGRVEEGLARL